MRLGAAPAATCRRWSVPVLKPWYSANLELERNFSARHSLTLSNVCWALRSLWKKKGEGRLALQVQDCKEMHCCTGQRSPTATQCWPESKHHRGSIGRTLQFVRKEGYRKQPWAKERTEAEGRICSVMKVKVTSYSVECGHWSGALRRCCLAVKASAAANLKALHVSGEAVQVHAHFCWLYQWNSSFCKASRTAVLDRDTFWWRDGKLVTTYTL